MKFRPLASERFRAEGTQSAGSAIARLGFFEEPIGSSFFSGYGSVWLGFGIAVASAKPMFFRGLLAFLRCFS